MRQYLQIGIFLLALLQLGCDGMQSKQETVRPSIQISFVEPKMLQGIAEKAKKIGVKTNTVWNVIMTVRSKGGKDYSPPPRTIDDATTDQISFDVSLPADSIFSFNIAYSQNGTKWAEGNVVQQITRSTQQVFIPVTYIPQSVTSYSLNFAPSVTIVRPSNTPYQFILKLDGSSEAIKALACKMQISGIDPALVGFRHALKVRQGNSYDLAWTWTTGRTAPLVLDTLSVPISQLSDIRLSFTQGTVQGLSNSNRILTLSASDARILVRP